MSNSKKTPREKPVVPETVYEYSQNSEGGMTLVRQYIRGKFLGKGGFARCYELICSETGKKYAGKVVAKASLVKPRAKQKFVSEIKIHKSLAHSHIVGFYHYFEDELNSYILLELCKNFTLAELIRKRKRLTETETVYFMSHILEGVRYCHGRNIIHRDLKLGNLFLSSDMQIKIGDFGLATCVDHKDQRRQTMCGTPNYIAPEILRNHGAGHSFEVDIWSIGVILYTMLVGRPPYQSTDIKTTYKRIKENKYAFPDHVTISSQAKDLVRRILQTSPTLRPTLAQIRSHSFFTTAEPIPRELSASVFYTSPKKTRQPLQLRDMNANQGSKPFAGGVGFAEKGMTKPQSTAARAGGGLRSNTTSPGKQRLEATFLTLRRCLSQSDHPEALSAAMNDLQLGSKPTSLSDHLWIVNHVDYSSKYGLGYLFSDGSAGVYFNDATKIIQSSNQAEFAYINRTSVRNGPAQNVRTHHDRSSYDKSLQKKVTLMEHFGDHLRAQNQDADPLEKPFVTLLRDSPKKKENCSLVYVRKWIMSEQALVFQLSSGVFQVSFKDSTQLLLSDNGNTVICANPAGQVEQMTLMSACSFRRPNLAKRIKYLTEVLNKMIHLRSANTPSRK